jgi:hypothetical protein
VWLALSSNEDTWAFSIFIAEIQRGTGASTIIGDAAKAITSACASVGIHRSTCWFHCKQSLKKRLMLAKFQWDEINTRINILQLASSEREFIYGKTP